MKRQLVSFNQATSAPISTWTFPGESFGPEAEDRMLVACLTWLQAAATPFLSATIGGVSATTIVTNPNPFAGTAIVYVSLPTGTSGTISFNLSSGTTTGTFDLYAVTGWSGVNAASFVSDTQPATFSTSVPESSVAIAVMAGSDPPAQPGKFATWTGLTEDTDVNYGKVYHTAASAEFATAQSLSASCTLPVLTGQSAAAVVLSN